MSSGRDDPVDPLWTFKKLTQECRLRTEQTESGHGEDACECGDSGGVETLIPYVHEVRQLLLFLLPTSSSYDLLLFRGLLTPILIMILPSFLVHQDPLHQEKPQ
jgi:hypothetical protein